jgi:hypothetical protein
LNISFLPGALAAVVIMVEAEEQVDIIIQLSQYQQALDTL